MTETGLQPGSGATAQGRGHAGDSADAGGRWLGHPGFLVCVLVLGVNDHVLKAPPPRPTDDDGV